MADITDPIAVRVAQETRELCNLARGLFARATDYHVRWVAQGLDDIIPDTLDVIVDGQPAHRSITGAEVRLLHQLLVTLISTPTTEEHAAVNRVATNVIGG